MVRGGASSNQSPSITGSNVSARDLYGWEIDPADENGVVRARTPEGQLTIWLIPNAEIRAVAEVELGKGLAHPGLYVLLNEETDQAYVGESSNLKERLGQWLDHPPKELKRFDKALIINDGRASVHSRFTDATLRHALEYSMIHFLEDGSELEVVNTVNKMPDLSINQQARFERLRTELGHVLYELELVSERPRPKADNAVIHPQDVGARFSGRSIANVSGYEGELDGERVYFRKGSPKRRGLQVTIRVGEPFGKAVNEGRGYLCVNRGRGFLIPTEAVKSWLGEKLKQQTVDIFLDIEAESLTCPGVAPLSVAQFGGAKASKV